MSPASPAPIAFRRVPTGPQVLSACAILLAGGAAACGEGGPPSAADGIDLEALPRLTLEEELRIGSIDDPDFGFTALSVDGQMDSDGNLYVLEMQDRQVRAYSPEGELLRTMGGQGAGPGEFRGFRLRFGVVRDTVWVMDWSDLGQERLTTFDREGRVISARRVEEVALGTHQGGIPAVVGPMFQDREGRLVGDRRPVGGMPVREHGDSVPVPRVRFGLDGSIIDTAGWYNYPQASQLPERITIGGTEYTVPRPLNHRPLHAPLPDGDLRIERPPPEPGARGILRVTRTTFTGDGDFTRTYRYAPVPYSEEDLDRAAAASVRFARPPSDREAARAEAELRERADFPVYQPPILGAVGGAVVHLGQDGRLWLQWNTSDPDTRRWILLAPDGTPVGDLRYPDSGPRWIGWSRGDTVWAGAGDELGIPWLVRYRLVRSP